MLSEVRDVRQDPGGVRRWWNDESFDLIVWYDTAGGAIRGYQLCYNRGADEHALTWTRPADEKATLPADG
jgi:hypothetical protein